MTEEEMVGLYHQLNGREFEQAPRDGEGHRSLQAIVHRVVHFPPCLPLPLPQAPCQGNACPRAASSAPIPAWTDLSVGFGVSQASTDRGPRGPHRADASVAGGEGPEVGRWGQEVTGQSAPACTVGQGQNARGDPQP